MACVLAAGGCMKIYPDPELPDVIATWYEEDCRDGSAEVAVTLTGVDDASRAELVVPCTDLKATFKDVARLRYHLEGMLRDASGETVGIAEWEVDLRDGFNERADLYFGSFSNFRISWSFDMGATCQSLAADVIMIDFFEGGQQLSGNLGFCLTGMYFGYVPDGIYTVRVRAVSNGPTVAVSPMSAEFEIIDPAFTNLGVHTLTPCGSACPP